MEVLIILAIWVALCALVGKYAERKGLSFAFYMVLSVLLSPLLMFLVAALRSPDPGKIEQDAIDAGQLKRCTACAEAIRVEARRCKHCDNDQPDPWMPRSVAKNACEK